MNGVLGIKRLVRFNNALLGKWLGCYGGGEIALWRSVVDLKYGTTCH